MKFSVKTLAIASVTALAVVASLGEASSSGDSGSDATSESQSTQDSGSSGNDSSGTGGDGDSDGSPSTADSWYADEFGTFEGFSDKGNGDSIIKLPEGVTYGVVTAKHKGSGNFALSVLDQANQPTGDLLVNTIGNYQGTTAFGLSSFGDPGVKIEVTADGSWSVQVSPISSAPQLDLPAKGEGDQVFQYNGPAADWNVTHKGERNFVLLQNSTDIMPNLAVNEIGNYKGLVPMNAGPSVVRINADGSWSISE